MAEVEEARDTKDAEVKEEEEEGHMESQTRRAMRSRIKHFEQQADSLTFEGVRRLLEEDLGLETYALDIHKRFVKQCLLKCLKGGDGESDSKSSAKTVEKHFDTETAKLQQLKEEEASLVQALAAVKEKIAQSTKGLETIENKAFLTL